MQTDFVDAFGNEIGSDLDLGDLDKLLEESSNDFETITEGKDNEIDLGGFDLSG